MLLRERVRRMLDLGASYEETARRLGVRPGVAYLTATGLPADGSDEPGPDVSRRPHWMPSSQHLANSPEAHDPMGSEDVHRWIRDRATTDAPMQQAAARRAGRGE